MKRTACLMLSLLLLLYTSGCSSKVPAGNQRKFTEDQGMRGGHRPLDPAHPNIHRLANRHLRCGDGAQAQAARDSGQIYEAQDNIEELREKHQELLDLHEELLVMRDEIDSLPNSTGIQQLDDTYAAAKTYFSELDTAYQDLLVHLRFLFRILRAARPIREFDGSAYSSFTQMEIMWNNVEQAATDMKAVSCPTFMSQTWEKFIKEMEHYVALIQTLYIATMLSDPLRYAAVANMNVRADEQLFRCGNELTNDFNLQFAQVKDRLTNRLDILNNELIFNCDQLLDAI